jgi:hypothetical protein
MIKIGTLGPQKGSLVAQESEKKRFPLRYLDDGIIGSWKLSHHQEAADRQLRCNA